MEITRELKWGKFKVGDNPTKEEILQEIERLKKEKTERNNIQSAQKIILNSIYGVLGFVPFILYNKDVAESVTTQSRTLIKYTIKIMNKYYREIYHLDRDLLDKLQLESVSQITYDVVNYADTDSVMMYLDGVFAKSNYKPFKDEVVNKAYGLNNLDYNNIEHVKLEFYLKVYHYGMKKYIQIMLDQFCEMFNAHKTKPSGQPSFKLTLEQINYSVLWLAKKLYIKNTSWGGNIVYEPLSKLSYKGIDVNKRTIPKFVRERMQDTIKYIMSTQGIVDNTELISRLRTVKEQFTTTDDIGKIAFYQKINNYGKYVINDTTEIKLAEGCPLHIRAAATYNYMLYNSKHKGKYSFIKSGSRIQYYHVTDSEMKAFGFLPGAFPIEFAIPMDVDKQYTAIYLNPMNNILEVLGVPNLSSELLLFPSVW